MAEAARRRATYEDLLVAPADRVAEIIDGELRLFPRPALAHARAKRSGSSYGGSCKIQLAMASTPSSSTSSVEMGGICPMPRMLIL
jgi:hypothetical protein